MMPQGGIRIVIRVLRFSSPLINSHNTRPSHRPLQPHRPFTHIARHNRLLAAACHHHCLMMDLPGHHCLIMDDRSSVSSSALT